MKVPGVDAKAKGLLEGALQGRPGVVFKPMFGNLAAFHGGNMFAGTLGKAVFLRLSEADRAKAASQGATPFDPVGGRPMKEYVEVPSTWLEDRALLKEWFERSLAYVKLLPPKEGPGGKGRGRKK